MKKNSLLIIFILILFTLPQLTPQQPKVIIKKVFKIEKAYIYKEASLLVSETDLYCSHMITRNIPSDIKIIGAWEQKYHRTQFSSGDKVYINKGEEDGIKIGDKYLVIQKGKTIQNPFRIKALGTLYFKKSVSTVTCVFKTRATIQLNYGCHPVIIGDILIPFKKENTIFERKPVYTRCLLPDSEIAGNVVYLSENIDTDRMVAGNDHLISVDLGKEVLSRGDFLLFYEQIKKNLPPLIVGTGIVVNPYNTNSTVKVLEVSTGIKVGTKVVLLPKIKKTTTGKKEDVPIMDPKKEKKEVPLKEGEISIETDIFYNIDQTDLPEIYETEFNKIQEFIKDKSEYIIILRGYSCSIGNPEYNLKLSKDRVDKLKKSIIDKLKIKEEFIETYFYGEKETTYDNSMEKERKKNRRVSIEVRGR